MNMRLSFLLALLLCLPLGLSAAPRELGWSQLIPEGAPPPPPPTPVHDLSQLSSALEEAFGATSAFEQQSPAAPVVKALDGQLVRIPGFIVPLDMNDDGQVTEFLLVPYYGACIHVPPPPSNQIVHVQTTRGTTYDQLYQPFWIEGTLQVGQRSSELAEAGYSISDARLAPYQLPDE